MRIAAVVCIVLSLGVVGFWIASGMHPVTHYQVPVEREIEDEFGDKAKVTELVDKFEFGFLPDKPWDGALSWIVLLDGLAVIFVVTDTVKRHRARRRAQQSTVRP